MFVEVPPTALFAGFCPLKDSLLKLPADIDRSETVQDI